MGSAILFGASQIKTDPAWSEGLLQAIPDAIHGMLVGVSAPVAHTDANRALYMTTGAMAVDMESHIVADVGATHGLPVAAVRVITDSAVRTLPQAAVAAMRPNGTADIRAMIRSVVKCPSEIPALLRTAFDARAARATLLQSRDLLRPALGVAHIAD